MCPEKVNAGDAGKTVSQAARVAGILQTMITNNELPPGSNYLEAELGEMLGVSRTPIREAAVILASRGLVEIRPRHGMRILPLTIADMVEIYDILIELEPLAAFKAAELAHPEKSLRVLDNSLVKMENALRKEDRKAWAAADDDFHQNLVALSGSGRLMEVISMYSTQVHRVRLLTLYMRPLPHASNENHRALYDAIRNAEPERARALHHEHRVKAKALLISLLEQNNLSRF
jgi:DNA-binding GntR family transcriptional regulator